MRPTVAGITTITMPQNILYKKLAKEGVMDLLPLSQIFISIYFNCDLSPCQFFYRDEFYSQIFLSKINRQLFVFQIADNSNFHVGEVHKYHDQHTVGAIHELPLL